MPPRARANEFVAEAPPFRHGLEQGWIEVGLNIRILGSKLRI